MYLIAELFSISSILYTNSVLDEGLPWLIVGHWFLPSIEESETGYLVSQKCTRYKRYLRNEFNSWNVYGIMSTSDVSQSK